MPRVLVCLDEVPAPDGSCAVEAWQEVQPQPLLPDLTRENVEAIAPHLAVLLAVAWCFKQIGRQIKS